MRSLVIIFIVAACSKDEGSSAMSAGGSGARDALLAAWKQGGLTVSAMSPATVAAGKDCQTGTVNDIDVLVCVYASPAEAKSAENPGLAWVGETTGFSLARGAVLIAAADRRKRDPSGRTLNQLTKLAPK